MAPCTVVIKNGCVITGREVVYPSGFVKISGGTIESAGPMSQLGDVPSHAEVIDAGGRYVLPGFINPHMHLYSAFALGMKVPRMRTFAEVLGKLWWRLDRALSLDDIRVSALVGGIAAIRSGVTTIVDHHASYGAIRGSLSEISDALAMLGLRANLCFEISDRAGGRKRDEALSESADWLEWVEAASTRCPDYLQRGMVGLHASMTLSDSTLESARELMDAFDVGAHVHVAEAVEDVATTKKKFGATPVAKFARAKILRTGTIASHCVHVNGADIGILKKSGATVVHNPMSNLNNAVGIAPVVAMAKKKIPIAIGTDGMSAGIFTDVKLAGVLHKDSEVSRGAIWGAAPRLVSRMFNADIGVLRSGAAADVIIIDAVPPTEVTSGNAWRHILFGVMNSSVMATIVGGSVRMKDYKIAGVDEEEIVIEAKKLSKKLWNKLY